MRPKHLEWPIYRWSRILLETGAGITFFVAFSYVAVTQDLRSAAAALVAILATYIAIAPVLFNRARALPQGPSQVRALYAAERATQATAFTLVGVLLGAVFFAWGAWFAPVVTNPTARTAWGLVYFLPILFLQAGYGCFTFTLRILAREFLPPLGVREIVRRIRNAP